MHKELLGLCRLPRPAFSPLTWGSPSHLVPFMLKATAQRPTESYCTKQILGCNTPLLNNCSADLFLYVMDYYSNHFHCIEKLMTCYFLCSPFSAHFLVLKWTFLLLDFTSFFLFFFQVLGEDVPSKQRLSHQTLSRICSLSEASILKIWEEHVHFL